MAFARHNIEKNRLIEMVRQNPILWDCRLPHYKRSDKKKDIKWCELGRVFNVSGERVQRTFTSLREIFRRELSHEKLLGSRFTSKWEYYGAMSFLKDVIRERKTRERYRRDVFKDVILEYSSTTRSQNKNSLIHQPDVLIQDSPLNREITSSLSSTPSISIKEELTDHDGDVEYNDNTTNTSKPTKRRRKNHTQITPIVESYPLNGSSSPPAPAPPPLPILGGPIASTSTKLSDNDEHEEEDQSTKVYLQQTPREILYTKFGEFLSARLNTLNETVANDLMNRILLLIAENR